VEKPLTSRLDEADAFVAAAREARDRYGAVTLMAYMKLFDPGYQYAQRLVRPLADAGEIRYVDARHIHAHNDLYMAHHRIVRTGDVPAEVRAAGQTASAAAVAHSLGDRAPADLQRAFGGMMGSSIHDVYALNGLLGRPEGVVSSVAWDEGRCRTAIFQYPRGARVSYAHIDVREVRAFKEEVVSYGPDCQVTISFPQPYLVSAPTTVTVQGMEPSPAASLGDPEWREHAPRTEKVVTAAYENPYKREWVHFHACITRGLQPAASAEDARADTAFIIEWARATQVK
jgi:predicted dehydrogenase